jgi:hypothetical protein
LGTRSSIRRVVASSPSRSGKRADNGVALELREEAAAGRFLAVVFFLVTVLFLIAAFRLLADFVFLADFLEVFGMASSSVKEDIRILTRPRNRRVTSSRH